MSELFEAARPFLARLTARLENHPDLRQELAAFARSAASFLEGASGPAPAGGFPASSRAYSSTGLGASATSAFRYGAGTGFDSGTGAAFEAEREQVALPIMAKRCRVKAEACRILVKRYSGITSETDESVPLFKKAAELPDCGLWMLTGSGFNITPGVWENLAGAYEAAAVACELMDKVLPRTDTGLEIGLNLAAESQSTLLYAVVDTGRRGPDTDQIELFIRIRETGAQRRIYIPKYLKRDDRADPDNWRDVLARLTREYEPYKNGTIPSVAAPETAAGGLAKTKAPDKSMHSVQYHLKKVKESPSTANWPWIFKLIDETLEGGLLPSDPSLRDLFLPVADSAPDDVEVPARVVAVYREIDRHLATHPQEERVALETPSQEMVKAAVLMGGKEVALVGGNLRPPQQKAIIEAFDLRDLRWIPATEPALLARYEAEIAKPEVAVVLYAMRWTGADYEEVKLLCEKHHKPLVKLPRGYNPNQIATELLKQAGERLRNG